MNSVDILIKVMAAAAQPFMCSCNVRLCIQSGSEAISHSMLKKRQAARTTLPRICETGCASVWKELDSVSVEKEGTLNFSSSQLVCRISKGQLISCLSVK